MIDPLLAPKQVCKILKISLRTFHRMVQSGRIPAFKIGCQWRCKEAELEEWFKTQAPRVKDRRRAAA